MTAFVADEHIPAPSIRLLREAGFDVLSIREQYPGLPDADIIPVAEAEERIMITCDRDFGELIFLRKLMCASGVVYLRLGDFLPEEPAKFMLRYLAESADVFERSFSVITRERLRQRKL